MFNKRILNRCFNYRKRYFYMNLKGIPEFFRETHFLSKHGYDISAQWSTCDWFIDIMKEVLAYHRYNRVGTPILLPEINPAIDKRKQKELYERNEQKWNGALDRMLALLNKMDENNPEYENINYDEAHKLRIEAKDEFFRLFSEYFYYLWD